MMRNEKASCKKKGHFERVNDGEKAMISGDFVMIKFEYKMFNLNSLKKTTCDEILTCKKLRIEQMKKIEFS